MEVKDPAETLFSALNQNFQQQQSIAKFSLAKATQLAQKKDYAGAIAQLKRAIALDPSSQDAYSALGGVYLQSGKTTEAVQAYKAQIRANPGSADAYNSLGNAYLQAGNTAEAEKQYKTSARMDASSTYAPYTLGNMYLQSGRYREAATQFAKVVSIAPKDAHGYYGMAAVDNKLGRYSEAVVQANRAISLKTDLAEAHFELGRAYLGLGDKEAAVKQATLLSTMKATLGSDLSAMIKTPKMVSSLPDASSINLLNKPDTLLSSLDPSLLLPNSSKDFTVTIQFDSSMDLASVTSVANWTISKAAGGKGGLYNNGVTLNQAAQAGIPTTPRRIVYDPTSLQATVHFTLSQNAAANAVIDPSHLVFKFSGKDANGKAMDPTANEVDGFGGLPY